MSHAPPILLVNDMATLTLWERIGSWLAWLVAVALFWQIGFPAMRPADPLGAVSVVSHSGWWGMFLPGLGLTVAAAIIATVLAGHKHPDAGALAAGIGLAVVTLRGGTSEVLLLRGAGTETDWPRQLALWFALESLLWFGVLLIALLLGGWLARKCFGRSADQASAPLWSSWSDLPFARRSDMAQGATPQVEGVKHMLLTAVFALLVIYYFSSGHPERSIRHGQNCFVVVAGVALAGYLAHHVVPVRSALWSVLAVGLLALWSYIIAGLTPASPERPLHLPASPFLRILPMQYVAVGTVTAIAMCWHLRGSLVTVADESDAGGEAAEEKGSDG